MAEVARRAGVGQATLYRNFPDRRSLAAALMDEQMERNERVAAEHAGDPGAFDALLRTVVQNMAGFYALGQLAREDACLGTVLERRRARLRELLEAPLRDAKAAGTIRDDTSMADVFLLIAAARGAMEGASGPTARADAGERVLGMMLAGLAPAASPAAAS